MLKKMICLSLILMLALGMSAYASTYEEGAAYVIECVKEELNAIGIDFRFTEYDRDSSIEMTRNLGYDIQLYANKAGNAFCSISGHDMALEVFECVTSNAAYYEDMLYTALCLVKTVYGSVDQGLIEWVNNHFDQICGNSDGEEAFIYDLGDDVFFLMHRSPGTNSVEEDFYCAAAYFPCAQTCPLSDYVAYIKLIAKKEVANAGERCPDCNGTGLIVETYAPCEVCNGLCSTGVCRACHGNVICKMCEGQGYIEMYNYVMEYSTFRDCTVCGQTGYCRTCRGTGEQECTYCNGLGYRPASYKCNTCGGDGTV